MFSPHLFLKRAMISWFIFCLDCVDDWNRFLGTFYFKQKSAHQVRPSLFSPKEKEKSCEIKKKINTMEVLQGFLKKFDWYYYDYKYFILEAWTTTLNNNNNNTFIRLVLNYIHEREKIYICIYLYLIRPGAEIILRFSSQFSRIRRQNKTAWKLESNYIHLVKQEIELRETYLYE